MLYNGRGTNQWTAAGLPLVTGESVEPECATSENDVCIKSMSPSDLPSTVPSMLDSMKPSAASLPPSASPNIPATAFPTSRFQRKFPKATGKDEQKLKTSDTLTNSNFNGIRGRERHLSHFDLEREDETADLSNLN